MEKFNGMAVVTVSNFTGGDKPTDKNEKQNVILSAICGQLPSKRVLAGTLAQNAGFIPGHSYLCSFTEGETDPEYGRQFNFANGGRVQPLEILQFLTALGTGVIREVGDMPPAEIKPDSKERLNVVGNKPEGAKP